MGALRAGFMQDLCKNSTEFGFFKITGIMPGSTNQMHPAISPVEEKGYKRMINLPDLKIV
jgi:hypothetical protein